MNIQLSPLLTSRNISQKSSGKSICFFKIIKKQKVTMEKTKTKW